MELCHSLTGLIMQAVKPLAVRDSIEAHSDQHVPSTSSHAEFNTKRIVPLSPTLTRTQKRGHRNNVQSTHLPYVRATRFYQDPDHSTICLCWPINSSANVSTILQDHNSKPCHSLALTRHAKVSQLCQWRWSSHSPSCGHFVALILPVIFLAAFCV